MTGGHRQARAGLDTEARAHWRGCLDISRRGGQEGERTSQPQYFASLKKRLSRFFQRFTIASWNSDVEKG